MDPGGRLYGFPYVLDGGSSWGWVLDKHRDAKRPQKKVGAGWSPQRTTPAFPFLPVLRIALCSQGVGCRGDGRSKLEGDQGRCCYGAGGFFFHTVQLEVLLIPVQPAGITQTTRPTGFRMPSRSLRFCPLGDFGHAMRRERAGHTHVLSTRHTLSWNFAALSTSRLTV